MSRFYGFDPSLPAAQQGRLKSFVDAGGNVTTPSYDSGGNLTKVLNTSGSTEQAFNYAYLTSGANAGKISTITLQRSSDGGTTWATVHTVTYTYYDGSAASGNLGDLQTAVITDASSNVLNTEYYRYYTPLAVTSLTYSSSTGLATATLTGHGLSVGDTVVLSGANQSQFNGTFQVSAVTSGTFSFIAYGSPPSTATGAITMLGRGYKGGLKYYFGGQDYQRLAAAVSSPLTAADSAVAPYASNYFEYDSGQRVTKEVAQGQGCSSCSSGQGTYTYAYSASSNADGYNAWSTKTVETLPDGNTNTVYSNAYGQQMLKVFTDNTTGQATSGKSWAWFTSYDSSGRAVLTAQPSAVALPTSLGTLEGYADLLHQTGTSTAGYAVYQYLNASSGLISLTDYASSTTATSTTAGTAAGYQQDTKIEQGDNSTPILQSSEDYFSRTGGGTVYPVADSTVYRNTDGTGAETTSNAYTWFSGTTQMQSMTTSSPVISSIQNGPGAADTKTDVYDAYGRVIWSKDGGGFITCNAYDNGTGALLKTIQDVDTTRTGDFDATTLPSGWSTPAGGGLHLITAYVTDTLGRTTKMTSPNGNVTYTVYDDVNHAARTYAGWNASTHLPTGPVTMTRQDRPNSYTETLAYAWTGAGGLPVDGSGVPTGAEDLTTSSASIQSLSRDYTNSAGQVVRSDAYFNFSGLSYATTPYIGTVNTNYYTTTFGYDDRGRQNHVVKPTGTITDTIFDGLGRVASVWMGTSDVPTSDLNGDGAINYEDFTDTVAAGGAAPAGS